jgi:hypothetical protein
MKPTPDQFLLGEPVLYMSLAEPAQELRAEFKRERHYGIPCVEISDAKTGRILSKPMMKTRDAVAFLENLP